MSIQSIYDVTLAEHYDMPVRHRATGEQLVMDNGDPMMVRVTNSDYDEIQRLRSKYRNEELKGMRNTAEREESRMTEMLVKATVDWQLQGTNGKPIPFSEKAARELYTDPKLRWLRTQVLLAVFDDTNFAEGKSEAA
ncbi:MAG: hypothetical protein GVY22_02250 [Gammaproteobacteria bacterium]|jgi:hypothetical protein|nr:hypothetical protein [Gammaproteobacteria bacterium]